MTFHSLHEHHRSLTRLPTSEVLHPGWSVPVPPMTITRDTVHIWRFSLDQSPRCIDQLRKQLSFSEQQRATKYRFHREQNRFIVGRSSLRSILSHYLGVAPQDIKLQYRPHGKPQLAPPHLTTEIQFNLTHSHTLALCAITRGRQVGIDLEYHREIPEAATILDQYFTDDERRRWLTQATYLQSEAFLNLWVCKEAYLKAIGTGFTSSHNPFPTGIRPHDPREIPTPSHGALFPRLWSLWTLTPVPSYCAAVVVEGVPQQVHFKEFPDIVRNLWGYSVCNPRTS